MEHLARIFIFSEMLVVNLLTTHQCSRRKVSITRIIGELTHFTILIFLVIFLIRFKLNLIYINGGILMLVGFSYFFPLSHLYYESYDKILAIMFFSWIHTMIVTQFSLQISTLFEFKNHFQITLIMLTIIYLFSTPVIIRFVKNKFLYILKNIPIEINKYFLALSLTEFAIIFIIYFLFAKTTNSLWKVTTGLLVALTAVISYQLIYVIVNNFKSINLLKHLAYTDNLTGVKNRLSFFLDCEKFISENYLLLLYLWI